MSRMLLSLSAVLVLLPGCRPGVDCGMYVFDEARQICVCPAGMVEVPGGCVASDGGVADAGPSDAGLDDGGVRDSGVDDAVSPDGGPLCVAETCNGADDDCDGLIDEGVLTVGPAVTALSGGALRGGLMVPLTDGFGILAHSTASPSNFVWLRIAADGTPAGSALALGADTEQELRFFFDLAEGGGTVFTAFIDSLTAATPTRLVGFDPVTAARTTGGSAFVVPATAGRDTPTLLRIAQVGSGRMTVYLTERVGSAAFVRRLRLDLSGATPTVLSSVDVAEGQLTNALGTQVADYVIVSRGGVDGTILLVGPAEDAAGSFRELGPVPLTGAMAIADASQPVSATNPLGIAAPGFQPAPASFVEITNATVLALGSVVRFADSVGTYRDISMPRLVDLIAIPALAGGASHWVVATMDNQGASEPGTLAAVLQVHEVISGGATVRAMTVPGEVAGPRADIRLARSGESIRVVEGASGDGLVSRSIGCE